MPLSAVRGYHNEGTSKLYLRVMHVQRQMETWLEYAHFKWIGLTINHLVWIKGGRTLFQVNLTPAYDYNQHQLLSKWLLHSPSKTLAENKQNHSFPRANWWGVSERSKSSEPSHQKQQTPIISWLWLRNILISIHRKRCKKWMGHNRGIHTKNKHKIWQFMTTN